MCLGTENHFSWMWLKRNSEVEINNSSSACDNYLHKNVQTVKLMLSLATEILLLRFKKKQNRNNPHIIFNIWILYSKILWSEFKMQYTNAVTTNTETPARKTNPWLLNSESLGVISF